MFELPAQSAHAEGLWFEMSSFAVGFVTKELSISGCWNTSQLYLPAQPVGLSSTLGCSAPC